MKRCNKGSKETESGHALAGFQIPRPSDAFKAPYPRQYESKFYTGKGALVGIRPIKPQDAGLLADLFERLSPETVFFRFLGHLKSLPQEWVKYFADIDYDRDVALVALNEAAAEEKIVGVCRIMREGISARGEMAVVVAEAWQGQGIGTMLMTESIRVAAELGIRSVWGPVSCENQRVLTMADKVWFSRKLVPRGDLCEIYIEINPDGLAQPFRAGM